jgi:hypothetical protein
MVLLSRDGLTAEGIAAGSGQEPAYGPPLAAPLCGQGCGRAPERCDPPVARQAVDAREDQAGGGHDAVCEATHRDAVERAQLGRGGSRVLTAVFADMACPQAQAALDQDFQGLAR